MPTYYFILYYLYLPFYCGSPLLSTAPALLTKGKRPLSEESERKADLISFLVPVHPSFCHQLDPAPWFLGHRYRYPEGSAGRGDIIGDLSS